MITLSGRATAVRLNQPLDRRVWAVGSLDQTRETPKKKTAVILDSDQVPSGADFSLYLVKGQVSDTVSLENIIYLPESLWHLKTGDFLTISADGSQLRVVWRKDSSQNFLFLTERCNHFCIMCSQPPREVEDSYLLQDASELVSLLPADTWQVGVTGGEPTLYGAQLIELLKSMALNLPSAGVHLLTNGRAFANFDFARSWASIGHRDLMAAIPLYSAQPEIHDYVVQSRGAFEETVRGIINLARLGQQVEIRVVIQSVNADRLEELARYISRNLPFVSQVALMGLEVTGFAKANIDAVWVDPTVYAESLERAVQILDSAGVKVQVFNHQLCTIPESIWPMAVKSISDWKNEYADVCKSCEVLEICGGLFRSSTNRMSSAIAPIGDRGIRQLPENIQFLPANTR